MKVKPCPRLRVMMPHVLPKILCQRKSRVPLPSYHKHPPSTLSASLLLFFSSNLIDLSLSIFLSPPLLHSFILTHFFSLLFISFRFLSYLSVIKESQRIQREQFQKSIPQAEVPRYVRPTIIRAYVQHYLLYANFHPFSLFRHVLPNFI